MPNVSRATPLRSTSRTARRVTAWHARVARAPRCATVGSLDEDQLFYLRARGIPKDLAHSMLTFAFLKSVVDRVNHEPTRQRMREALLARIPHGDDIRGVA